MNRRIQTIIAVFVGVAASAIAIAQPAINATPARNVTVEAAGTVLPVAVDTARTVARSSKTMPTEITIDREIFDYDRSGRRDPYKSLMTSSDVRPLLSDLRLTAVAFDPNGDNSVAILRDAFSKKQYRIRVGQQLGRLRVSGIKQKTVQFTI